MSGTLVGVRAQREFSGGGATETNGGIVFVLKRHSSRKVCVLCRDIDEVALPQTLSSYGIVVPGISLVAPSSLNFLGAFPAGEFASSYHMQTFALRYNCGHAS